MSVDYLVPGNTPFEKVAKKAYWDIIFEEITQRNRYDLLVANIAELKGMLKALIPNRSDIHEKEFDEFIDVDFLKQKFENGVFKHNDFVALFSYIIEWIKKLGCEADDVEVDLFKSTVISVAEEKGYFHILPYSFDAMHGKLEEIAENIRKFTTETRKDPDRSNDM